MAATIGAAVLLHSSSTAAREKHQVGRPQLTTGWEGEPAFTGSKNAVSVAVADVKGSAVETMGIAALAAFVLALGAAIVSGAREGIRGR